MKPSYYLTDLDGTLLRPDASLSDYTTSVITAALDSGAVVSYATARSLTSSSGVVSGIPWKYPIVLYNGGMLYDPVRKEIVGGYWLEPDVVNGIVELGKASALSPLLFGLDSGDAERVLHEKLIAHGYIQFYNSRPGDARFRELEALQCPDDYRTLIITYIGLFEELEPLHRMLQDTYGSAVHLHFMKDNYIADHFFLEISHPKANKGDGLELWAGLVGCKPSDVTVFGDNLNDKSMFAAAGRRVAVADAHIALREMADHVAGSCSDDGVARFIEAELMSRQPVGDR